MEGVCVISTGEARGGVADIWEGGRACRHLGGRPAGAWGGGLQPESRLRGDTARLGPPHSRLEGLAGPLPLTAPESASDAHEGAGLSPLRFLFATLKKSWMK